MNGFLCCHSWVLRLFKLLNEIGWKFHGRGKSLILGKVQAVLLQNRCHVIIHLFMHPLSLKIFPFVESPCTFGSVIVRTTSKISNGHLFESEQFWLPSRNDFILGERLFLQQWSFKQNHVNLITRGLLSICSNYLLK